MISQYLIQDIAQYGYVGLYCIIAISILGMPVPDELLMTFVGYLTVLGKLNPFLAIFSAAMGSITGITVEYFLGMFFREKVLAHLRKCSGNERLERVFNWYHRYGGILLATGYFIPGVRHLTGYVAGLSRMNYRNFALFAYLGATFWTILFINLGRLVGSNWSTVLPVIHHYSLLLGITVLTLSLLIYFISRNRRYLIEYLTVLIRNRF